MFTISETDRLVEEFNALQNRRRTFLKKIWGFFLGLAVLLVLLFLVLFPKQFDDGSTAWILPTYGGMAVLAPLIGLLISLKYKSEKPFFEYLYPKLYEKLMFDEGMHLEYTSYLKEKDFNLRGGLFTSWASVTSKRQVLGQTEDSYKYQIYDTTMVTSNGKSQTVHFDGIYFVLQKDLNTSLQIRTNGSPKLKGTKFKRVEEIEQLKVYKQEGQNMSNIDHSLLRYVERLKENETYKRFYLSVVENEIHLALSYRKHPARKQKVLNTESINKVYQLFADEIKMISEIANIDVY